jgi:hypothetical protein
MRLTTPVGSRTSITDHSASAAPHQSLFPTHSGPVELGRSRPSRRCPPPHDTPILLGMSKMVASAGHAHTVFSLGAISNTLRFLPIKAQWFADGLFVTQVIRTSPPRSPTPFRPPDSTPESFTYTELRHAAAEHSGRARLSCNAVRRFFGSSRQPAINHGKRGRHDSRGNAGTD